MELKAGFSRYFSATSTGYVKMVWRSEILGFDRFPTCSMEIDRRTFRKILGRDGKIVRRLQSCGQDFVEIDRNSGKWLQEFEDTGFFY